MNLISTGLFAIVIQLAELEHRNLRVSIFFAQFADLVCIYIIRSCIESARCMLHMHIIYTRHRRVCLTLLPIIQDVEAALHVAFQAAPEFGRPDQSPLREEPVLQRTIGYMDIARPGQYVV